MGGQTHLTVPESLDGSRFDLILARLAGVSRASARRMIESGGAGLTAAGPDSGSRPRTRLRAGDGLWFAPPEPAPLRPHPVELDVRYEDRYLAVIGKPAGMVTHPGPGHGEATLVSALLHRWPEVEGVGEFPRWGIVHRLDMDTSGAILIALHPLAHRRLTEAMAAREVRRRYLTLTHGGFAVASGTIDAPIDRRRARRFVGPGGKPAVTHYRRLATWDRPVLSLLEVTLETGRTHQIRVHLGSIDRPVVGDRVYGRPARAGVDPGRVWLHAHRLGLVHPVTRQDLDVEVPLPSDLRSSLEALGRPAVGEAPRE